MFWFDDDNIFQIICRYTIMSLRFRVEKLNQKVEYSSSKIIMLRRILKRILVVEKNLK